MKQCKENPLKKPLINYDDDKDRNDNRIDSSKPASTNDITCPCPALDLTCTITDNSRKPLKIVSSNLFRRWCADIIILEYLDLRDLMNLIYTSRALVYLALTREEQFQQRLTIHTYLESPLGKTHRGRIIASVTQRIENLRSKEEDDNQLLNALKQRTLPSRDKAPCYRKILILLHYTPHVILGLLTLGFLLKETFLVKKLQYCIDNFNSTHTASNITQEEARHLLSSYSTYHTDHTDNDMFIAPKPCQHINNLSIKVGAGISFTALVFIMLLICSEKIPYFFCFCHQYIIDATKKQVLKTNRDELKRIRLVGDKVGIIPTICDEKEEEGEAKQEDPLEQLDNEDFLLV